MASRSLGRMARGRDLALLLRRGRSASSEFFRIAARPSGAGAIRLAIVAGKAVDKRATARNRLRRRIREYVRTHQNLLPSGRDLAITIKKDATALSRSDFYDALRRILARVP